MNSASNATAGPNDGDVRELLSFLVGGQDFCIDIMSVREIRGSTRATSLPHAPPFIRGVINLRGTVLPIMDLACRLDLEAGTAGAPGTGADDAGVSVGERNVTIVVADGERTVGLMVDAVSDILAVPDADLQPPPDLKADSGPGFISALTIVDGRMIRLLDLAAVLPPSGEAAA